MTIAFGKWSLPAALVIALSLPAAAQDVLFENVRIFDGSAAALWRRPTCWSRATHRRGSRATPIADRRRDGHRRRRAHADAGADRHPLAHHARASAARGG